MMFTERTPSTELQPLTLLSWAAFLLFGCVVHQIIDVANGFPKTCQEVHKLGDHDGYYHLDPEQDGFDPILVYCNISTTPVTAVLHHNREEWTHVHGYNAAGSYDGQLLYADGATVDQIRALILTSTSCTYFIQMRCYSIHQDYIFWISYYGRINSWEKLGGTFCQQETGNATCKCGANTRNEIIDTGDAGNWPLFPVTSLRLGDTNDAFEYIDFRIGPLVCKQERMMLRRFLKMRSSRLNTDFVEIKFIRSMIECSAVCNKMRGCLGFNFKRGPPIVCEICYVPQDAPGVNTVTDPAWNHYTIVP